ncbi:MAG: methyltransferase [Flavobacteriaceae bacterium]
MRKILKTLLNPFLKKGLKLYYSKPRKFSYDGVEVLVHPDVFPPHLTLSTKILLDYISLLDIGTKTFLELGCGSGIISLYASKKGAKVTATDINETALEYLNEAASKQGLELEIFYSDLFGNLKGREFNFIIINPPYYPKNPQNIKEKAWYCGEDYDYFKNLFQELPAFCTSDNTIVMILSEDCKINTIENLALKNNLRLVRDSVKKKYGEVHYVFKIATL